MKETKKLIIIFYSLIIMLCGCGNKKNAELWSDEFENSSEKPSEKTLRNIIEQNALTYSVDEEIFNGELVEFKIEKGQQTGQGHYDAYCRFVVEDSYMSTVMYYVLNCSYYDKSGWEVDSSYSYSENEIIVNSVPEHIISEYLNDYMTFVSDETTYEDNNICYTYDYNRTTDNYDDIRSYEIRGNIYCIDEELFDREYTWNMEKKEVGTNIVIRTEAMLGTWMAEGSDDITYYITVDSISDDMVDWMVEDRHKHAYYNMETHYYSGFNGGSTKLSTSRDLSSVECSFDMDINGNSYYDEVCGCSFNYCGNKEFTCNFTLDNLSNSYISYPGCVGGYKLTKVGASEIADSNAETFSSVNGEVPEDSDKFELPSFYEKGKLVVKGKEACSCGADVCWNSGIISEAIYYYKFNENEKLNVAYSIYLFDSMQEAEEQAEIGLFPGESDYYCDGNLIIVNRTADDIEDQFGKKSEEVTLIDLVNYFSESNSWEIVYK